MPGIDASWRSPGDQLIVARELRDQQLEHRHRAVDRCGIGALEGAPDRGLHGPSPFAIDLAAARGEPKSYAPPILDIALSPDQLLSDRKSVV